MEAATNAVCLETGGFLLVTMDQIPKIVRRMGRDQQLKWWCEADEALSVGFS